MSRRWLLRKHHVIQLGEIQFIIRQSDSNGNGSSSITHLQNITTYYLQPDAKQGFNPNPFKHSMSINITNRIQIPEADLPRAMTILAEASREVFDASGLIVREPFCTPQVEKK